MKKIILFLFVLFGSHRLLCQDLIITNIGDSIKCKIINVKTDNIYFQYNLNSVIRNSFLPRSSVKKYSYNFYKEPFIQKEKSLRSSDYKPVTLSIESGFSYRLAKLSESIPENLENYYQKLKPGFNIGFGVLYNLDETVGIGFKYQCFITSNYDDNAYLESRSGVMKYGTLSDKINISFFGTSLSLHSLAGHSNTSLYSNYSLGYFYYRDENITLVPYKITGGNLGFVLDGGWDVYLSDSFIIGIQGSLTAGVIRKFKINDGNGVQIVTLDKGNYESLYRIDLTIGFRFKL